MPEGISPRVRGRVWLHDKDRHRNRNTLRHGDRVMASNGVWMGSQ